MMCEEKQKLDKKGAITAKNWWWEREHRKLEIYECPNCKHWHLTHRIIEKEDD